MTTNRSRPSDHGISRQTFLRGAVSVLATAAVFPTTQAAADRNHVLPARRTWWGNQANTAFADLPATDDTGQDVTWLGSGDSPATMNPTITNGLLITTPQPSGTHAWYREWEDSSPVTRIGGRFVFDDNGGALTTTNGVLCMAMTNATILDAPATTDINVHFVVRPTSFTLMARNSATGTWTSFGEYTYPVPLKMDGETVYEAEVYRVDNVVTMLLPDGTIQTYTDTTGIVNGTAEGWSIGNWGFIEQYCREGTTDDVLGWVEFWADTTNYANITPTDRPAYDTHKRSGSKGTC